MSEEYKPDGWLVERKGAGFSFNRDGVISCFRREEQAQFAIDCDVMSTGLYKLPVKFVPLDQYREIVEVLEVAREYLSDRIWNPRCKLEAKWDATAIDSLLTKLNNKQKIEGE